MKRAYLKAGMVPIKLERYEYLTISREYVFRELLEAAEAALAEYHPTARDGDPIAEKLMAAIAKAKGGRENES